MVVAFATAWKDLRDADRAVLELAWRSCSAGTMGVGAVVVEAGRIIAAGCNATRPRTALGMPIEGSYVGHAEINALAAVPTDHPLQDCVVVTSLRPCMMCAGAMVMSHVGSVRYLAADPLFADLERLVQPNEFIAAQWPRHEAAPADEWATVAMLLSVHSKYVSKPHGATISALRRHEPEIARLLKSVCDDGALPRGPRRRRSLVDFLDEQWAAISRTSDQRSRRIAEPTAPGLGPVG